VIKAGDTIENPITGERITFRKTAAETNGEAVVIEVAVQPGGFVAAAHVHPQQTERFSILSGTVAFKIRGQILMAGPGENVTVPAGTPHKFWVVGDEEARFVTEVRPALKFAELLDTMFALARDGKTNKKGLPNPFRMAVIANHFKDVVRLPFPPVALQDVGLLFGVPAGRMLGYRPTYAPTQAVPATHAGEALPNPA
jgi:mannose-6-phosphate isomerase-like protein (cupin superfamily)